MTLYSSRDFKCQARVGRREKEACSVTSYLSYDDIRRIEKRKAKIINEMRKNKKLDPKCTLPVFSLDI